MRIFKREPFVREPSYQESTTRLTGEDVSFSNSIPLQPPVAYSGSQSGDSSTTVKGPLARPRRQNPHVSGRRLADCGGFIFVADVLLTFLPCIFLILAFEALSVDGQPIDHKGKLVEQAAKLSPTLFPIIFAAVVGRLMRTYALWRAERGSTLGVLEALNGSQNLLSALERAIVLPGLGAIGVGIILLWGLSPVGGQSSLRVLSRGLSSTPRDATVYYFNNTGSDNYGAFEGASAFSSAEASLDAIFDASLISLQVVQGNDPWGNLKVPILDQVASFKSNSADKEGFFPFSQTAYNSSYSALSGIIIAELESGTNSNFTMESSYFNLTCSNRRTFNVDENASPNTTAFYGGFYEWANPYIHSNISECLFCAPGLSTVGTISPSSYLIDTNYNFTSPSHPPSQVFNLIYASWGSEATNISAYNCTVGNTHVESRVYCSDTACHIDGIRPSRNISWPAGNAPYPFPVESVAQPLNLLNWLGSATPLSHSAMVSPVDWYISGSDTPFTLDASTDVDYTNVTGADIAERLGTFLNTGWQLSFQLSATAQKPSTNITALLQGSNITVYQGGTGYDSIQTRATRTVNTEIFIANKSWIVVTIIIAFILLTCGIASMIFKYGARSPDILGFVSSMTRDNVNFMAIPGGDRLDGLARARRMGKVKVQIADVRPWETDGHITLVRVDEQIVR